MRKIVIEVPEKCCSACRMLQRCFSVPYCSEFKRKARKDLRPLLKCKEAEVKP
jgi:hypothetical protein